MNKPEERQSLTESNRDTTDIETKREGETESNRDTKDIETKREGETESNRDTTDIETKREGETERDRERYYIRCVGSARTSDYEIYLHVHRCKQMWR